MRHVHFDSEIILAGGGMVGLSLALAAAQAGFSVLVLDAAPPMASLEADFDGRVSALGRSSCRLLAALGVWPGLAAQAQPILDILVSDGRIAGGPSPLRLHFDHKELGGGAEDLGEAALGHILENRHLRLALHAAIAQTGRIAIRAPEKVIAAVPDASGIEVTLASGESLRGRLCVAADGRNSPLRQAAGVKCVAWEYDQSGIVSTVAHERPHHGVAHEYFLPGGPFAMLPMTGNRSSLVWTEPSKIAQALMGLGEADFDAEMRRRFGAHLGAARCEGKRFLYPISFQHAHSYVADRLALAGDAAHTIHPIAGQGLNLGLRDAAALAEVLCDARRIGLDIGAVTVLERYQQWRRFDNVALSLITDGLNRLFSSGAWPLRLARDLGLDMAGRIGPLRRLLMRHAAGESGELPRLLKGLPLN